MSDRWLTVAFFVAGTGTAPTLEELAARAGVAGGQRGAGSEFDRAHLDGHWAGLRVRVGLSRMRLHDCLRILVRQQAFLAPRALGAPADLPLAEDPSLPLAEAFRDACLALPAEVGLFLTHPRDAGPDPIDELYRHVLGGDAEALAQSFPGLLYLDERAGAGYQAPPDRDTLPAARGLVLFAGRGQARWY